MISCNVMKSVPTNLHLVGTKVHIRFCFIPRCVRNVFFCSVMNCGMNFQWNLFEFTATDCQLLGKALQSTPTLKVFRLREAKVSNERGRMLIAHLLDHPSLQTLGG